MKLQELIKESKGFSFSPEELYDVIYDVPYESKYGFAVDDPVVSDDKIEWPSLVGPFDYPIDITITEDFITEIDEQGKTIEMDLPEGILDL